MAKFDWEKEYEKKLKSGRLPSLMNPEGSMYAQDLRTSGGNIARGKASPLDYLTVALAPTALAGFGAARGARAALAGPAQAATQQARKLAAQKMAINLSQSTLGEVVKSGGRYIPDPTWRGALETEPLTYGFMMSPQSSPRRMIPDAPAGTSPLALARQEEIARRNVGNKFAKMGNPSEGMASAYFRGAPGATMVLKDRTKARSTISPTDMSRVTTPAKNPNIDKNFTENLRADYLETRTRGGVNLADDVERILVTGGPEKVQEVSKMLKDAGYNIPVSQINSAFRNPNAAEKLLDKISYTTSVAAKTARNTVKKAAQRAAVGRKREATRNRQNRTVSEPEA